MHTQSKSPDASKETLQKLAIGTFFPTDLSKRQMINTLAKSKKKIIKATSRIYYGISIYFFPSLIFTSKVIYSYNSKWGIL